MHGFGFGFGLFMTGLGGGAIWLKRHILRKRREQAPAMMQDYSTTDETRLAA